MKARCALLVTLLLAGLLPVVVGVAAQPAGAQTVDGPRPEYPWTATDPPRTDLIYYPGSVTTPYVSSQAPTWQGPGLFDPGQGWTFEAWVKMPVDGNNLCLNSWCEMFQWTESPQLRQQYGGTGGNWRVELQQKKDASDNPRWRHRNFNCVYSGCGTFVNTSDSDARSVVFDPNSAREWSDWFLLSMWWDPNPVNPDPYNRVEVWINGRQDSNRGADGYWNGYDFEHIALFDHPNWNGAHIADARFSYGTLSDEAMQARYDAIQGLEVTGPLEPGPGAYAPSISCGRSMRDMGNGSWWADAEALVLNPAAGAVDSPGEWTTSWSSDVFPGRTATIPLPADATNRTDLFISYYMERTHSEQIGWAAEQETGLEWSDGHQVVGGPVLPGWALKIPLIGKILAAEQDDRPVVGEGWMTFDVDGDGVVGDVVAGQAITKVRKVGAGCTIRVAPVFSQTDPPVVIVNVPPHPDDDGPPVTAAPPPPGSEDDAATCGGGSWWNPFTWAKSLFCRVGDIVSGLVDLLAGILDGLKALFIPDDFGFLGDLKLTWESRFPLSVLSDANGAAQGLHDRIDQGVNGSPCSVIDPNMDAAVSHPAGDQLDGFRVTLPSPVGACGEDANTVKAANLAGWRPPLRAFLGIFIWLAFFVRVVTSFGPKETGLEPDPEAAVR